MSLEAWVADAKGWLRRLQSGPAAKATPAPEFSYAEANALPAKIVLDRLGAAACGLTAPEAERRLERWGPNLAVSDEAPGIARELLDRTLNPLNALLFVLALVSYGLGDVRAAVVIGGMVILAIVTAFIQEHRSSLAAARLRAMIKTTASVLRPVSPSGDQVSGSGEAVDVPIESLVPGDVVQLAAGDMIPADLRLLSARDLFLNQSALTGESMPVERHCDAPCAAEGKPAPAAECANVCLMGANVVSGYASGVVIRTGRHTLFGEVAEKIAGQRVLTSFDKGIDTFTWLMIRFIAVMVPAVFLINGMTKGNWLEALLFAVAVAVGLTPEMLPMIVTVNLAKGAYAMSEKKVIVKRLNAIQNFGAMDILATDKTGTLTQDRIVLKRHIDIEGNDCGRVLEYAYLNSRFQSGLRNLLDVAVLKHAELEANLRPDQSCRKIDEIPFDFTRRRLSVVVERGDGKHLLICKGAVEEIFSVSTRYQLGDTQGSLDPSHLAAAKAETARLNADGFRVVAVAYREIDNGQHAYSVADERDLTLLGYIAFLDPPKDSARPALDALKASGVGVKILTGDNEIVTRKICSDVGLDASMILLGTEIGGLSEADLMARAETVSVFAKVTPEQKARVIKALQKKGHVVGFMGDGINDSLALKAADVGISVDTAVDIAKESADIILLEKSLMVLREGVIEGRKVFGNITKYIRMGASSNFGNMFSVLGASIFLPFLPMAPIQVLTNNLLYDFSQTAIPTDRVDSEYLAVPRRWDIGDITRYMLVMGPVSSLFDYLTFGAMIFILGAWDKPALFQTGWFVESLLSQTLIIHVLRTAKIPFLESTASPALTGTTAVVCLAGILLVYSPLGGVLGFTPLPDLYWLVLAPIMAGYGLLAEVVKRWLERQAAHAARAGTA